MKSTNFIIRSAVAMLFLLMATMSYAAPAAMSVVFSSLVSATTMTSYCQAPPMKQAISPNIMLVIDVSGSMDDKAYSGTYDSNKTYEGYFDPAKYYAYVYSDGTNTSFIYSSVSTTLYYEEEPYTGTACQKGTCENWVGRTTNPGGCIAKGAAGYSATCGTSNYCCCSSWGSTGDCGNLKSGNRFNFDNMRKVDLLRWAMTGGTPAYSPLPAPPTTTLCAGTQNDGTYCDPQQWAAQPTKVGRDCNPTNGCVLSWNPTSTTNSYQYKVRVPWNRVMNGLAFLMQTLPVVPRMGSLFYSGSQVESQGRTYLGDFSDTGVKTSYMYDTIIASVNSNAPNGSTPTGPAMWDVLNYYAQKPRQYNGLMSQQTTTDTWRNPMYNCDDASGSKCVYIPCVDNFVILMSDGEWNQPSDNITTSATGPAVTTDSDPVVPAYVMHHDFLNTKTTVTTRVRDVYTISLFQSTATSIPSGRLALKNVAMYGSYPVTTAWPEGTAGFPQVSASCSGSSGSLCTSLPTSTSNPITACKKSWDKDCNGIPDTYASGDTAEEIKDSIYAAILEILSHTTAGTAASVLASREGSGANLLQAVYYPKKSFLNGTVDWVGNLQNLWYYIDPAFANSSIREDGRDSDGITHDNILNLKTTGTQKDYITQFFFDPGLQAAMAHRWTDNNGDASIAGETQLADIKVDDVSNIWEAGNLLWSKSWLTRKLITSLSSTNYYSFSCTAAGNCPNKVQLAPYLNVASNDEASTLMEWVLGNDNPTSGTYTPVYRQRAADIGGTTLVWKLGDIINSTPKISSWQPLGDYNITYRKYETTYGPLGTNVYQSDPVNTAYYTTGYQYKGRGMVYTGGNDGMLHAFRLGLLQSKWSGQGTFEKAKLTNKVCSVTKSIFCGSDSQCPGTETCSATVTLGEEVWAFIPKNALPYLKYLANPDYMHVYTVDLTPTIFDASIAVPTGCAAANYYDCLKTAESWRTVLIGGMRLGGADRKPGTVCTNCINTPLSDPITASKGLGYSSYFALDITDQNNPTVMWDYDGTQNGTHNNSLGLSYSGPAVVRISNTAVGGVTGAAQNNGKWLVVFGSGPTGPIDTKNQQFLGLSDQDLMLHVFDLATGPGTDNANVTIIDTNIPNTFSGSITTTTFDIDLDYSDDVIYVPYTTATTTAASDGGLLRLVTNGNINPANWTWSQVITNAGPITAAPDMLIDPTTNDLWLFFGTGRYFYDTVNATDDADPAKRRQIFGMKERCLNAAKTGFDPSCSDVAVFSCPTPSTVPSCGGLTNVDNIAIANNLEATKASSTNPSYKGWYINLDPALPVGAPTYYGERVITNPSVDASGIVYYTSFKPQNNACVKDGQTNIWAVKFDTGGSATGLIQGTAIIQVSTGSIEQINLSTAFTQRDNRRTGGMTGQPPTREGLTVIPGAPGVSKPLFMKER
jgi:type IV pilus assembly protein PilY1